MVAEELYDEYVEDETDVWRLQNIIEQLLYICEEEKRLDDAEEVLLDA